MNGFVMLLEPMDLGRFGILSPHRPRAFIGDETPVALPAASAAREWFWVPFRMARARLPMLSAMTLDELGAKMRCDKCGNRPARYHPARQDDAPGYARSF